jgi:transposase
VVKYTEVMLREAVTAANTMADVLRHFGLPQNGGSHAHLRRRINALGIDTSHFTGRAVVRADSRRRQSADAVLVLRDRGRRRAHPEVLRRAIAESGIAATCAECGLGSSWNGRPLILHVDHVNGKFWDCRIENLRLLCPNCHSQTPTYAGRNRRIFGVRSAPAGDHARPPTEAEAGPSGQRQPVTEEEIVELLGKVDHRELTASEAARRIGCHRAHLQRLRQRLQETGSVAPRPGHRRWRSAAVQDTVIAYALAHPDLGPKAVARRLRNMPTGGCSVSHGTVSNILREAGLNTISARRSRLTSPAEVAESADARDLEFRALRA